MAIKRNVTKKPGAPKRARSSRSESISVAPRILSSEEKRELILAHAAARRPLDPIQRFSLWSGVAICLLFVVGAWIYTVGSGIKRSVAGPLDPNLQQALDATKKIGGGASRSGSELQEQLSDVTSQLDAMADQDAIFDQIAADINASSTTSTHPNLFQPSTSSSHE